MKEMLQKLLEIVKKFVHVQVDEKELEKELGMEVVIPWLKAQAAKTAMPYDDILVQKLEDYVKGL